MQQSATLLIAAVTLVLPGPTNILLALAGATTGVRRAAHLALAAIAGYGLAVSALATVAAPLVAAEPVAGKILRLAAATVLLHASLRLWRYSGETASVPSRAVGWSHVFLTTLLNPKALVLAVLIMPEENGDPYDWSSGGCVASPYRGFRSWLDRARRSPEVADARPCHKRLD